MKPEYNEKEFKKLEKENKDIRRKIENFCNDFNIAESKIDLWNLINSLIDNELNQESMCS